MRIFRALLLALLLLAALAAQAAPAFFLRDGDRVVFYGDSITDTEWYPTLVQTYVLTRYPAWRNTYFNRGLSGDNSGSLKRFERDVVAQKPDVFTFMMGYNDGGYAPLKAGAVSNFISNITESVRLARAANPQVRPFLIGPTPNETEVSANIQSWVTNDSYSYTLLGFSRAEGQLAARLGVGYVDMAALYGQTLGLGRVVARQTFLLSRDGVHPQQEGQTFMAYHLLRAMSADPLLAEVTLDAAKAQVVSAARCKVTDLKVDAGNITFTRLCTSLPYPTPEVARPFMFLVDLDNTLNQDMLTVKGLTAPSYALSIDGVKIAEISTAQLADGVNLSAYPNTPMYRQAMKVMDAVRSKDLLDCAFWRDYISSGKADGNGKPVGTDAAVSTEVDGARKKVTEAAAACYTLNTPKPHTITLTPLETKIERYADLADNPLNQGYLDCTLTPLAVNWNTMTPLDGKVAMQISNPGGTAQSGTVTWQCPTGWTVEPAQAPFSVEAGKKVAIPFTVRCAGNMALPPPTANLRWRWSAWPYPLQRAVELALAPRLTIAKAKGPVTLDGKLDDWANATAFTMDNIYFVDPAVQGKKALWGGPDDLSARVQLQWDDQAFYFAAVVRDDVHIQNEVESMMWIQDMVQLAFYMRGNPDKRYELGFGVYADGDKIAHYSQTTPDAPPIQFKSHLDDAAHTCTYEIAIPWSRIPPAAPAPGKSFLFTVCIGENDPLPGKGYNYLAWTGGIAYGKNPYDMGTVVLGE